MPDSIDPQLNSTPGNAQNISGGVDLNADQISIDGNVVGRDYIEQKTTHVTNVGMSPEAVRKLVITVGVLVFFTAACFFASGIFIGTRVVSALNLKVDSDPAFGDQFASFLDDLGALPTGTSVDFTFNVNQLSSYVRHVLGPQIGLENARVRVLENGEFVFYGSWSGLGGQPVALLTTFNPGGGPLLRLTRASLQIIKFPTFSADEVSPLLWVPVSNAAAQPLLDAINADLGAHFQPIGRPTTSVPGEGGHDDTGGKIRVQGVTR